MKIQNIIKQFTVVFFLLLVGNSAFAQLNIFRAGNVKISCLTPTVYGKIEAINDGSTNTDVEYRASPSSTLEFIVECNTTTKLVNYVINNYYSSNNGMTIKLSGSQDKVSWDDIDTRSTTERIVDATVVNTIIYKYYKFTFTNITNTSLDIRELEAYSDDQPIALVNASPGLTGDLAKITWNKISKNGKYEIERSTNGVDFTLISTVTNSDLFYNDSKLQVGTDYWYRIRAVVDDIKRAYSLPVKVTTVDDVLKDAPKLSVTAGSSSLEILLTWSGLNIYTPGQFLLEKSEDGINFTLLKTFDKNAINYLDATCIRNKNYWYRIKGVNYKSSSPYSNVAAITAPSDILVAAPTLTITQGLTGNVANLSWGTLVIYTKGQFQVERSVNGIDFVLIGSVDKNINNYADASLTQSTDYWYRVRGINEVAPSPYSAIVKITTKSDILTLLPTLTATTNTGTNATLKWVYPINTPGSFELEKSTNNIDFKLVGKFDKSISSFIEESLSPNTTYQYRIRGFNYTGYSPYSLIASVTTNGITAAQTDITDDGGTLAVSADNPGDEQSSKLIDNDIATKWLMFNSNVGLNLSATYQPKGSYVVNGYTLTTANDSPSRDPRDWTFSGSNDGNQWVILDTRTQEGGLESRLKKFTYYLTNPGTTAYKFYKINFTNNNGPRDGIRYQIAEWEILGIDANAPVLPANLKVSASTDNSVTLTWNQDVTRPVVSYVIQRSTDGLNYNTLETLAATPLSYTDNNLADGAKYYYRIKAIGNTVTAVTGWSNVAEVTTQTVANRPLSPTFLKITSADEKSVNLTWQDRATDETKYVLQRSEDNITFSDLLTLDANTNSATDKTVWPAKKYYYKILAYKDNIASLFSNTEEVTTPGFNNIPLASVPILTRNICGGIGEESFVIQDLLGGPGNESTQTLKVIEITTDKPDLFSNLSFTPEIKNGYAYFKVIPSGLAKDGDIATISLKVQDNGGTYNYSIDVATIDVKIAFTPATLKITADADITAVPKNKTVILTGETNYPVTTTTYLWDDAPGILGSKNGLTLAVKPVITTTYTLHTTSTMGCTVTSSITLNPADSDLIVSNVLTPNGDGKNDTWIIFGLQKYPENYVKIMDRSGRTVFNTKNYQNDWDGTFHGSLLPQGGYYYIVERNNGEKAFTGTLVIVNSNP
ncbi:T9SS type B sorting domain-containing protein [Pedobacter nototheniae]|uniref:T9SS type B sorting domain-containing protein n=1 Tax=Pedobacter nototheniae TaxID=2488994 RepID=UPI00103D671D|nr:gliding motility-associated C-terminal domain-containing protein [Pedobacter nototheniae]